MKARRYHRPLKNIPISCELTLGKALAEVVSLKMLDALARKRYYHQGLEPVAWRLLETHLMESKKLSNITWLDL